MEKFQRMILGVIVKGSFQGVLNEMTKVEETLQKNLTKARFMAIMNPLVIPHVNNLEKHYRIWEEMKKVVEDIINLDWINDESVVLKYESLEAHWGNLSQEREKTEKEFESLY